MSRIGKLPIEVPSGVQVTIKGSEVTVKGKLGELSRRFNPDMTIRQDGTQLLVERPTDLRHHRAMHGLTRALLSNMVEGVSTGFEKKLVVIGTGYRAQLQGRDLQLSLGFSHDILVTPPPNVSFEVEGGTITVKSADKHMCGQVAADIRKLRPPEPYKGKGVRYQDEYVRQKAGKSKV
ncbi:MAG: 50S ribosomal protein L6 [Chloroflexi bacterium]|nr:50S ribosomal protein L6 [Chloroflexota bacterium]